MEAEISQIAAHNLWDQVYAVSEFDFEVVNQKISFIDISIQYYFHKNFVDYLFQQVKRDSMNNDYTNIEASKPENRSLNRYRDVYPYDHSRVVLQDCVDTDYINASLVQVLKN